MARSATGMAIATLFVVMVCNALLNDNFVLMQEVTLVLFIKIVFLARTVTLPAAPHLLLRAITCSTVIKARKKH